VADEVERLMARDKADSTRAIAPLRRADDAVDLDTTHLTLEQQVAAIVELTRKAFPHLDIA
jgi:cytidylate kinase